MENCDFKVDLEFSKNPAFQKDYDNFYKSEKFREKYIKTMYRKNIPTVKEIIRSENLLLQKGVGIDVIVVLSNKTTLAIDEKTDRYKHSNSRNIFLEIMSNPGSDYQTEGWAYHRGRYFCYSCSNVDETGLYLEPVFFFIDENFVNAFNRNNKYKTIPCNKKTNGLYSSLGKLIPKQDIINFMCNKKLNEKIDEGVKRKYDKKQHINNLNNLICNIKELDYDVYVDEDAPCIVWKNKKVK